MRYDSNSLEAHWMPFTANRDFKQEPRLLVEAQGLWCIDHKGGKVMDASSGLFCTPLGHGRKDIAEAVHQQLLTLDYCAPFQLAQPGAFELANLLSRITPEPINHIFFTNSGSESVDTALKIAMAYHRAKGEGQRTRFVSRERAYHGVNIGGVSLSGMIKNRESFGAVMPNIALMRHTWDADNRFVTGQPQSGAELADDLQRFVDTYGGTTIAACIVEPVAGSTGVLVPPVGYLERLREICDANGILLIFDEVICGFGRLGTPFGAQAFGVTPDIMTMAKALTNGCAPMGAVAVADYIYDTICDSAVDGAVELFHGYTYSAHPIACAAGIVTQRAYIDENMFERAANLSGYFLEAMATLRDLEAVTDIRGCGLLAGIDIMTDGAVGARGTQMQKALFWKGLHIKFTGDSGIIAPPFIAEERDIDHMIDILRDVLS